MLNELKAINSRPAPFQFYTADELWTNEHTSKQMLEYHLNEAIDASSRKKSFIKRSVEWIASHFKIEKDTKRSFIFKYDMILKVSIKDKSLILKVNKCFFDEHSIAQATQ